MYEIIGRIRSNPEGGVGTVSFRLFRRTRGKTRGIVAQRNARAVRRKTAGERKSAEQREPLRSGNSSAGNRDKESYRRQAQTASADAGKESGGETKIGEGNEDGWRTAERNRNRDAQKIFLKKMLKCSNQSGDACVLSYREAKRGKFA